MKNIHTINGLIKDLKSIGLQENDTVIVHSSLKNIGSVIGGSVSIILALEKVLTNEGTLVMPTFSEHLCDPKKSNSEENELVRENMPIYYKDLTPVDKVNGFLTEIFRKQDGVIRSDHPHLSFAAWGKHAKRIIENHKLDFAMGKESPLGKLFELNAKVLLLGSPKDSVTALHLSEYSVEKLYQPIKKWEAKIIKDGMAQWVEYIDVDNDSDYFSSIIDSYIENGGSYNKGKFGNADSYLFPMIELINYGVKWMEINR